MMRGEPTSAEPPPFLIRLPPGPPSALVLSVPHAGRFYPDALEAARAVPWSALHDLEDRYVDRLIGPAVAAGATAVVATHARAWLDLNRAPADRESAPASPQARAGLGIVPQRLAGRALWRIPTSETAIDARVASCHGPYHAAVATALAAARVRHGRAILIDCHSMPPIAGGPSRGAGVVIGDRHGASAGGEVVDAVIDAARAAGLRPARNAPYAGAYTLQRHGRPTAGIHALQVEVDRSLYLMAGLRETSQALDGVATGLASLCAAALAATDVDTFDIAAE